MMMNKKYFAFSYGDEQELIIAVVTNRVYVWQKRLFYQNIKYQKRLQKSKPKHQTIIKIKAKYHLIV